MEFCKCNSCQALANSLINLGDTIQVLSATFKKSNHLYIANYIEWCIFFHNELGAISHRKSYNKLRNDFQGIITLLHQFIKICLNFLEVLSSFFKIITLSKNCVKS